MEKLLKVLTDPEANRIVQLLRICGKMTVAEILAESNMSRATVYRKVDKLLEAGAICITGTNKVRGQTENVYSIKDIYISNPTDGMAAVTIGLMGIIDLFDGYFRNENSDVNRDKLFMLNYAAELSDEDFSEMMQEISTTVDKYSKRRSQTAKLRNLYFISAPDGGNTKQ